MKSLGNLKIRPKVDRVDAVLPTRAPTLTTAKDKFAMADDGVATQHLTFKYRLLPTKGQHRRLREALEHSRQLYNAALEERIDCYRKTGKGRSLFDQCVALTEYRKAGSPYAATMERAPLKALDVAYRVFFARGGFPRFKGKGHFKSIGWYGREGWRVRDGRIIAKGIGAIRINIHRQLPCAPVTCRIKREGSNWYVCLGVESQCETANDNSSVGIDVGISSLAALSNGQMIPNIRAGLSASKRTRQLQRALARCKRASRSRTKAKERLARARRQERHIRETYLHQVSADLTKRFGIIAIERLNVEGLARGILARSVNDVAWGSFIQKLRYKAERAGRQLIEVDPRYTSQTCPECGSIKPKTLAERVHSCPCGCVMDRDVAAAKVVLLRAAVHGREALNVAGCGERAPRKAAAIMPIAMHHTITNQQGRG